MNVLKQFLHYVIWIAISFAAAFGYMWMLIGPEPSHSNGILDFISLLIYRMTMIEVVPITGSIIAILFILLDVFYLKKKLKNNPKIIGIQFLYLIFITCIVGLIHYQLEKVLDVI